LGSKYRTKLQPNPLGISPDIPEYLFHKSPGQLKLKSPLQNDQTSDPSSRKEITNFSDLKGKQERKIGIKKQRR